MSANGGSGNVNSQYRGLIPFKGGPDPRRSMTGGRPQKLVELEKILDEHRTPEMLRPALERLRELAFGEPITITTKGADGEYEQHVELRAHPGFMKLYLERVLGPISDTDAVAKKAAEMMNVLLESLRAQRAANGG